MIVGRLFYFVSMPEFDSVTGGKLNHMFELLTLSPCYHTVRIAPRIRRWPQTVRGYADRKTIMA